MQSKFKPSHASQLHQLLKIDKYGIDVGLLAYKTGLSQTWCRNLLKGMVWDKLVSVDTLVSPYAYRLTQAAGQLDTEAFIERTMRVVDMVRRHDHPWRRQRSTRQAEEI